MTKNFLFTIFCFGFHLFQTGIAHAQAEVQSSRGTLEVVFSPAKTQESHLQKARQWIDQAQSSLDIAMYSMSRGSTEIIAAIKAAKDRQLRVRLLLETGNADRLSPEGSLSAQMELLGVDVRYINKIMHHKMALIDARGLDQKGTPMLITGSANWTSSAAAIYDENTLFVKNDRDIIKQYRQEFDHLWTNSRDFVGAAISQDFSVEPLISADTDSPSSLKAFFTSANFQVTQSRYGKGFSVIEGKNTVSDQIVALIQSAQHSIQIASGHFRSYAIANALIQAKKRNPQLDVKIYLDAQEFISSSYNKKQAKERDACLNKADTQSAKNLCFDKGYYYSYEAQAAGLELRFKSYAYRWHYSYAAQMHHKYVIVDNKSVLTGSYNFSDNAEHDTIENLLFISRDEFPEIVDSYAANFYKMWDLNRPALDTLMQFIETSNSIPLVFPPMALTQQELSELKNRISANCEAINSEEFRNFPEKHLSCPRTSP